MEKIGDSSDEGGQSESETEAVENATASGEGSLANSSENELDNESPANEDAAKSDVDNSETVAKDEPTEETEPTQADLFGDEVSSSEGEAEQEPSAPVTQAFSRESQGSQPDLKQEEPTGHFPGEQEDDMMEESAEADAEPEEAIINVEIPKIGVDLGSQLNFVKFPNFLSVEPRPFDAETYEDEIDDDEVLDEEGRSRLKLKCENTIRWRNVFDEEGNLKKESNAKIVRWSDGSMSLYLGSEIFDIHMQPLQEHNHLFIRQGTGLQGQAVFRTKLSFRPHSTESFTHRKLTMSMADKSNKTQKVKVLAIVGKDPEAQKQEMLRKEEERLRATQRRETQQRRIREKTSGRGLSTGYLEDDDEEGDNSISLSAIKKSYKPGGANVRDLRSAHGHIYSSESEESDEGTKRLRDSKAALESDDEATTSSAPKKKKARVIEESDDEANEDGEKVEKTEEKEDAAEEEKTQSAAESGSDAESTAEEESEEEEDADEDD